MLEKSDSGRDAGGGLQYPIFCLFFGPISYFLTLFLQTFLILLFLYILFFFRAKNRIKGIKIGY